MPNDRVGPSKGLLVKLIEFLGYPNPEVLPPVLTDTLVTGLGPHVDRATKYLLPEDKQRLQQAKDLGRLRTNWDIEDTNVNGTYDFFSGIGLSPNLVRGEPHEFDVAKTLTHELQHSRQPPLGITRSDIRLRPEGQKRDPYWDSPRETDARSRAAELLKIWGSVDKEHIYRRKR